MSTAVTRLPDLFRAHDRVARGPARRRVLAAEGLLSLLLHALTIAVVLWGATRPHLHDYTAPSPVAVVLEGGPAASTPQTEESRRAAPTSEPDPQAERDARPGSGARTPPTPPPGLQGRAPSAQSPPAASSSGQPTPAQTPGQAPAQPPTLAIPALPHGTAPVTLPLPARARPPRSTVARGRPAVSARAQTSPPAAAGSPFAALNAPMDLSLTGRPPPPASAGHLTRGINLAMAPTDQNRNVMTRYAEARRRLGEDWWAAFSNYVEQHKYYPMKAAENGEDGQSVLRLVVERDGTVRSVRVELSSGSPSLDMAWISEFRGRKVPAFPPGTIEDELSFSASMTYILEHM